MDNVYGDVQQMKINQRATTEPSQFVFALKQLTATFFSCANNEEKPGVLITDMDLSPATRTHCVTASRVRLVYLTDNVATTIFYCRLMQ